MMVVPLSTQCPRGTVPSNDGCQVIGRASAVVSEGHLECEDENFSLTEDGYCVKVQSFLTASKPDCPKGFEVKKLLPSESGLKTLTYFCIKEETTPSILGLSCPSGFSLTRNNECKRKLSTLPINNLCPSHDRRPPCIKMEAHLAEDWSCPDASMPVISGPGESVCIGSLLEGQLRCPFNFELIRNGKNYECIARIKVPLIPSCKLLEGPFQPVMQQDGSILCEGYFETFGINFVNGPSHMSKRQKFDGKLVSRDQTAFDFVDAARN